MHSRTDMSQTQAVNLNSTQTSKRPFTELSPTSSEGSGSNQKVADLDVSQLIEIIKGTNQEIVDKLDSLAESVEDVKHKNDELTKEVVALKAEREKDRLRICLLEDEIRRNNLIFIGLSTEDTPKAEIQKVCSEILGLPSPPKILYAKKIFEREGKMTALAKLDSEETVETILENSKKLAESDIYIERDLSQEKRLDKKVMLELKKNITKTSTKYRVQVRNHRIKIDDKWFHWNNEKMLMCGKQDGYKTLQNMYGKNTMKKIDTSYQKMLEQSASKNGAN